MEMRGAMKVLNDTLQKSSGGDIPKHVKTAVNIVQQEWFKVHNYLATNGSFNALFILAEMQQIAKKIIADEIFELQVSSTASANPLDVEYYLDCFEEISGTLLEYVVNMADVSVSLGIFFLQSDITSRSQVSCLPKKTEYF